jgi:hypothetical protein
MYNVTGVLESSGFFDNFLVTTWLACFKGNLF